MARHTDPRGVEWTAAGAAAVRAFDAALTAYLRFDRDTGARLKAVLEADPDMPMAHVLRGCFLMLLAAPGSVARAPRAVAEARARIESASPRERLHLDALQAWCEAGAGAAAALWERILIAEPRDVLALRLAHHAWFYLGDAAGLRGSVARVLSAWDETLPGHGHVLGMYAFGLEETGAWADAERVGREAVAIEPEGPWGVHAVAHALHAQDRCEDGIAWLEDRLPRLSGCNNFRHHLSWHLALMQLGSGRRDQALRLYDQQVWDAESDEYLDLCNQVSLLLRLEAEGVDPGARWRALAGKARPHAEAHVLAFVDPHLCAALAAGGEPGEAVAFVERRRGELAGDARVHPDAAQVALALCDAIRLARDGDHAGVVARLDPVRDRVARIGGSEAQRDLFRRLLIDAALGAHELRLARALLSERIAAHPQDRWGWTRQAALMRALGDPAGAARAEERADRLAWPA